MQTGRKFRPPSDQFCGCDVSGDLALLPAAQRQWTHAGRTRARASERASAALTHSRTDARARGSVSSPGGSSFQLYPRARPSRVSFFSLLFVFGCALSSLYSHWDHSLSYSLAPFHPLVFSLSLSFFYFNWEWWRTSVAGRVGSGVSEGGNVSRSTFSASQSSFAVEPPL